MSERKDVQKKEESDMLDFLNNPHETQSKQPSVHASDAMRTVSLYAHSDAPASNTGKILAFIVVGGLILILWNLDYIRGTSYSNLEILLSFQPTLRQNGNTILTDSWQK